MQAPFDAIAESRSEDRCERRYPRTIFSVPIRVRTLKPGGVRTTRGISLDISEGGLGALVQSDLKPGDVIEIDLSLAGQDLTAVAIVRHSCSVRSGCEFVGLTSQERLQLLSVVKSGQNGPRSWNA
jgi:c-di-GMP-binding flagellar brake protein YcgR